MAEIPPAKAIGQARNQMRLDVSVAATALRCRREDRLGESYYLVILGDPEHATGVVAVGCMTGEVLEWADLPGTGPHLTVGPQEARERAGMLDADVELVWRPARATRSLLYPAWRVESADGSVYVDQQGTVWDSLEWGETGG